MAYISISEVPRAANIKISVLWDVTPCSLFDGHKTAATFSRAEVLLPVLLMETTGYSKTSTPIYLVARCHIPED